ncbi:uncharacterized protein [Musca autumnalis]|uniref:uncharacterized protein n=1 Tax=Musca autumnalis TaxID=221902 RepID=UPI003CEBC96B
MFQFKNYNAANNILWIAVAVTQLYSANSLGSFETVGGDKFYVETSAEYTWFEALNICLKQGMTLVTIESWEKQLKLLEITPQQKVWIGGHDLITRNKFEWISNGQKFNFTNWLNGPPPNNNGTAHCVEMLFVNLKWNSLDCNERRGFICEIPVVKDMNREITALKETHDKQLSILKINLEKCSAMDVNIRKHIEENISAYAKDTKNEINRLGLLINEQISQPTCQPTKEINVNGLKEEIKRQIKEPLNQLLNIALNQTNGITLADVYKQLKLLESSINEQYSLLLEPIDMTDTDITNKRVSTDFSDIKELFKRHEISINERINQSMNMILNQIDCKSSPSDNNTPIGTNQIFNSHSATTLSLTADENHATGSNELPSSTEKQRGRAGIDDWDSDETTTTAASTLSYISKESQSTESRETTATTLSFTTESNGIQSSTEQQTGMHDTHESNEIFDSNKSTTTASTLSYTSEESESTESRGTTATILSLISDENQSTKSNAIQGSTDQQIAGKADVDETNEKLDSDEEKEIRTTTSYLTPRKYQSPGFNRFQTGRGDIDETYDMVYSDEVVEPTTKLSLTSREYQSPGSNEIQTGNGDIDETNDIFDSDEQVEPTSRSFLTTEENQSTESDNTTTTATSSIATPSTVKIANNKSNNVFDRISAKFEKVMNYLGWL